jgi:hypothetical protein
LWTLSPRCDADAQAGPRKLIDVFLGTADWSTYDVSADTHGGTQHYSTWATQPFVTFAGPWAEARWTLEHEYNSKRPKAIQAVPKKLGLCRYRFSANAIRDWLAC